MDLPETLWMVKRIGYGKKNSTDGKIKKYGLLHFTSWRICI
jgi:hypothetical protein